MGYTETRVTTGSCDAMGVYPCVALALFCAVFNLLQSRYPLLETDEATFEGDILKGVLGKETFGDAGQKTLFGVARTGGVEKEFVSSFRKNAPAGEENMLDGGCCTGVVGNMFNCR